MTKCGPNASACVRLVVAATPGRFMSTKAPAKWCHDISRASSGWTECRIDTLALGDSPIVIERMDGRYNVTLTTG